MSPAPRLLFYVQHLLGIGHLVRGARIAAAAAAEGFDATVVLGGGRPAGVDFGGAAVHLLPPIACGPGGFSDLRGPDGQPVDEVLRGARRDALLDLFDDVEPDVLLVEAYPFGRRQMAFELKPLLEAAARRAARPLVACSVRDILQENRAPGRDAESVELLRRYFDLVLVHGDPALVRLEASFPLADAIADRLAYTGIVAPPSRPSGPEGEAFEVIVSVGGGAVGGELVAAALAARPLSRLREAPWLVLTGPNGAPPAEAVPTGVTLRPFAPDLPDLLRRARLSVSQAGYNTVADLFAAPGCRAVLVPYVGQGETEQTRRAALLEAAGLAVAVDAKALTPARLAAAIDAAIEAPRAALVPDLGGARRTATLLRDRLGAKRPGGS